MKKKIFALMLAFALSLFCVIGANAADRVSVTVNGRPVEFDVPPMIISDRTMIPMRATFELLGANVEWVDDMKMALATYKTSIVAIQIGMPSFTVTNVITNETQTYALDVPAQIVNSRTLIPLRAISEALGKTVGWDGETRTVSITD